MAKYNLDRSTWQFFVDRVRAVRVDSQRQWGTMIAAKALRHLTFTFEMSLGMQKIDDPSIPVLRTALYYVFFCWFTNWPKGRIKGPAFITPEPAGDFDSEQQELLRRMEQYIEMLDREPERVTVNPGLGPISIRTWSRVHGVHLDHHLRQFGV